MTNFEFYKDEILAIGDINMVAFSGGKIKECNDIMCGQCLFSCKHNGKDCTINFTKWLCSEYTPPKPTITKQEFNLLSLMKPGYISRDKNNWLWWYRGKPRKAAYTWERTTLGVCKVDTSYINISNPFPFITWNDPEPWAVSDLLELEVMEE